MLMAVSMLLLINSTSTFSGNSFVSMTELLTALTEVNHTLGTTILMVTHDPYAASYTDRILYFKDGHIISELQRHDAERRRFYEAIMQESARQDEKR